MQVVITGAGGLLGWHLRSFLKPKEEISVSPVFRDDFADDNALQSALKDADVVVHLAGKNRGEEEEVYSENIAITERLLASLDAAGRKPLVIFASSTQVDLGTRYGESKTVCSGLISDWCGSNGAKFLNIIYPHLFGEHGKPFYNSVVSTFCHLLNTGGSPEVHSDAELNLLHCLDASEIIFHAITSRQTGEIRPQGKKITVAEMLDELTGFKDIYKNGLIPDVSDHFRLRLFNTYRSFIPSDERKVVLKTYQDNRGRLFEAVKADNAGQVFFSYTEPGVTRGEHYHTRKVERFLVVAGKAAIRLRRVYDDEVFEYIVSGEEPAYVDIPTLHVHNITNIGDDEMQCLFWVNEFYDPDDADTYMELVKS